MRSQQQHLNNAELIDTDLQNLQSQQQNSIDFEYSSFEEGSSNLNQQQNGGGGISSNNNVRGAQNDESPNNNAPSIMTQSKGAAMLLAKRKKSLMTRFIPGRNGPSGIFLKNYTHVKFK